MCSRPLVLFVRSVLDVEIEREFPWMRAQANRVHFLLALVTHPGSDQIGREDVAFEQKGMSGFLRVERARKLLDGRQLAVASRY
jgi:hypothetical protein